MKLRLSITEAQWDEIPKVIAAIKRNFGDIRDWRDNRVSVEHYESVVDLKKLVDVMSPSAVRMIRLHEGDLVGVRADIRRFM